MSDRPTALILRTAGTNCDAELCRAFELAGAEPHLVHVNTLLADPSPLERTPLIGLPGGFSHGDDIAAGRVLAVTLREHLAGPLRRAAERGALIIGICNGFQVLVQCGLLPDPTANAGGGGFQPPRTPAQTVALAENHTGRFLDRWVRVESDPRSPCVWTAPLVDTGGGGSQPPRTTTTNARHPPLRLPIAHGEGRVVLRDAGTLSALKANHQIALRYTEPVNGSAADIAGLCDPTGRIFGLMPHPERFLTWQHDPHRAAPRPEGDTPALAMFRAAVEAARALEPHTAAAS